MVHGQTPNPDERDPGQDTADFESSKPIYRIHSRGGMGGQEQGVPSDPGMPQKKNRGFDSSTGEGMEGAYRIRRVSSRGGAMTNESSPFDNVRIGYKLLTLVLLLVTPAAALLVLLILEKNIAIEFSAKERHGVTYSRPTVRLLEAVAVHGWAGQTTTSQDLSALTAPRLKALEEVHARLGDVMVQNHAGGITRIDPEVTALVRTVAAAGADGYDPRAVSTIQDFIARINDVSNLILDPDLDSYYLMDLSMLILPEQYPQLIEMARVLVQASPAPGDAEQEVLLESDLRAKLSAQIGAFRSALRRHQRGLGVARENNPANTLTDATSDISEHAVRTTEKLLSEIERIITKGKLTARDREVLLTTSQDALLSLSQLWDHSFSKLDELLAIRIQGFESRKIQALTGVGLGFLFAVMLAYSIAHRINRRVSALNNIAHRIADDADIDVNVDNDLEALSSRDELGDLAQTLSVMTLKLRRSIDEIRNKSLELEQANQTLEGRVARRTAEISAKHAELSKTLDQLEKTKDQLIVQEKMASLGSLTAGIAHEIKNPLNFVNNFAELSIEIATEIREILEGEREKFAPKVIEDLEMCLDDLEQNVAKIHEHGKRADSIVKGMLQHSRGGIGEFITTSINHILDEYVNLAYHGMRAQDSTFNVTIEKDFDRSLPDIPVVPQDISRVFLNIVNNGCYAANMKKQLPSTPPAFMPTISASTRRLDGNRVEIRIRDNGTGMPESVRAKIFEPFFTTKPTGVGTGLGLSLSYDIVVQEHRGTLEVISTDGEGTEFIITLPMTKESN